MRAIGCVAVCVALLGGCSSDSCREYSAYTCKQLESKTYNVYYSAIVPASGELQDKFLGQAVGLGQCGALAYDFAALQKARPDEWSYVCCLQTDDSECAEKHR